MKTWKKAAIGGLLTLVSFGYTYRCFVDSSKILDEILVLSREPKLKRCYELKDKAYSLNLAFYGGNLQEDHRNQIFAFDKPNHAQDMQKTLQTRSELYNNFVEANSQLKELSKDREFQDLKRKIDSKNEEYRKSGPLGPLGSYPPYGIAELGMAGILGTAYTIYTLVTLRKERKVKRENEK